MSWIYESITRDSAVNKKILATRLFGRWEVIADGGFQTTPYVTNVWKHAMRQIPKQGIKKILMLGFATGGLVENLMRRYPSAKVTAIEWDPVMLELATQLKLYRPEHQPRFILGDVREVLPKLTEQFDLILCDVFQGLRASDVIAEDQFLSDLRSRLGRDGYLLVNTYKGLERFTAIDRFFSRHKTRHIEMNDVALYRHFGQGNVGDPLPEGYRHFRATDAFVLREGSNGSPWHPVGVPGCMGARWMHGPLRFEGYQSDQEPVIEPGGPRRMITWQPFRPIPKPAGWHQSWSQPNARLTGFSEIVDPSAYWKTWTAHAQRHRAKWLREQQYEMGDITGAEFIEAYQGARMKFGLKGMSLGLVKHKMERQGSMVQFHGARDRATGRIVAGFAVVDVPESNQAYHLASFMLPETKHTSVGVGLVDEWFKRGIAKGFRYLDFDLFYAPGDPSSWKGFSRFKGQFGVTFIRYPKPFIRFVW